VNGPTPACRAVILARGGGVTGCLTQLRGHPLQIRLATADLNFDVATAIRIRDELTRLLSEILPGAPRTGRTQPTPRPFAPGTPWTEPVVGEQAHPPVPAVPDLAPESYPDPSYRDTENWDPM
jgi:hypothetical protein